MFSRILVSRTDRAGDLVLTLPVFAAIRKLLPGAKIFAHVKSYTSSLVADNPDVDEVILDDSDEGPIPLIRLSRIFKKKRFTSAILVHPSFRAIASSWLAGVPVRAGRASNVWQFMLNRRLVQNRSSNQKHEAEYNLDLLRGIGLEPIMTAPRIPLSMEILAWGRETLDRRGLRNVSPVIIHPGHGGSADNLSLKRYHELAGLLRESGFQVCITAGNHETNVAREFHPDFPVIGDIPDLLHVAAILGNSLAFLGGSTGPMHIAGAVGKPVVAFFPPKPAMTPRRWGPFGDRNLVLMPNVEICCGSCAKCPIQGCMDRIDFSPIIPWLKNQAEGF